MATALLGRQTPRLQLTPESAWNVGDDAVEFAARIGVPLDPWQQLALRNGLGKTSDGLWSAFEVGVICQRQNGKGSITDVLELYALFVLGLSVVIHSAHRLETSRKAFRVIKGIIERNPDLKRRCLPINPSDEAIEMIGGGRLEFRTRSGSGGRGLTGDLLVLDEALELTAEQIAAIVPVLAAVPGAQVWYTSTVPQFADQHLCKVRASAMAGAPRLAYVEWGVDKGVDLADPVAQAEANPAFGVRISSDRLADLRRILGDEKFSTECMGIWPEATAGSVLDRPRWQAMLQPRGCRERDSDVALMLDVTPMLDHGSIGLYAPAGAVQDSTGRRTQTGKEHIQLVDYRPGIDWMVDRAAELAAELDPFCWVIDAKNGAHALLPALREKGIRVPDDPERPHRGGILVLDAQMMADAVGQFIAAYRKERFQHIGQEPLDTATENVRARPIGDGGAIAWGRKASAVDIGPVVTVTGARYGLLRWQGLPPPVTVLTGSLMA